MTIRLWSTTPGSNNSGVPNGAPEGMAPGGVNNVIRQNMAEIRDTMEQLPWFDFGDTPTRIDNDTFTVVGDLTGRYTVGRRLKLVGATTGYATITASTYTTLTTVDVTMDTGNVPTSLATVSLGLTGVQGEYKQTAAEIAASVTPTNYNYPAGWLPRYGCTLDGTGDNTTAINNAIAAALASGGTGWIYHPGGNIRHTSQVIFGNGLTVFGHDRNACVFTYVGTGSAWRTTNNGTSLPTTNTSGFGKVNFRGIKITTASGSNVGAAIEINACGYSFYEVELCWLTGNFKYGVILDGTEITSVHNNIIDNNDSTALAGKGGNVWIVNGADRISGQGAGFSNVITIRENQLNTGSGGVNVVDDGGSNHHILDNNMNGAGIAATLCSVATFTYDGNDMENALSGSGTGDANVRLTDTTYVSGASRAASYSGRFENNNFRNDMAGSGGSCLVFTGTAMHYGMTIKDNTFGSNVGRGAAVDVTKLANSFCGYNVDQGSGAMSHYSGNHNDADGNVLLAPQNGSSVTFSQGWNVWGDNRYGHQFYAGIDAKSAVKGLNVDTQKWQNFTIQVLNSAGTLVHAIEDNFISGSASQYADKVSGASSSFNTLPTNLDASHGFTAGLGLLSGSNDILILNTITQTFFDVSANIVYYDGNNTRCKIVTTTSTRNINGSTLTRIELRLKNDMTGAAVNFDTTLLPAGKSIAINVTGFIA